LNPLLTVVEGGVVTLHFPFAWDGLDDGVTSCYKR